MTSPESAPTRELDEPVGVPAAVDPSSALGAQVQSRVRDRLFGRGDRPSSDTASRVLDGKYKLLEHVGAGGMGDVYRAEHVGIGKTVAVKVLKPELAEQPEFYARFVREAKAASKIDHPRVVTVNDIGETEDRTVYYVMEHLVGEDFGSLLARENRLAWPRLRELMFQVIDGLAVAHEHGIVHRDLKPDNFFLVEEGGTTSVKILDFGIARVLRADELGSSLTTDGKILGSPRYMSPEQALGKRPDTRTDIYSLGVVIYEALTGRPPFAGGGMFELLKMHIDKTVPSFAETAPDLAVDPRLEAAVKKALAKDPDKRFQSAREFADALRDVDAPAPKRSSSFFADLKAWGFFAAGLAVGIVVMVAVL